jgi:hypothetical protein
MTKRILRFLQGRSFAYSRTKAEILVMKTIYMKTSVLITSLFATACLFATIPSKAQQTILAGSGHLSQGGITCTVSIGEVFTCMILPSSGEIPLLPGETQPLPGEVPSLPGEIPSLSPGTTRPATKEEISASSSGNGSNMSENLPNDRKIKVSYDPPAQTVHIIFASAFGEPRMCQVYTPNGVLVHVAPLHAGRENAVRLNGLAQGVYILHITAGNISETVKLIKTK